MRAKTLKFRVMLYLAIALTLAMLVFTVLVVQHQRDELLREAVSRVAQISDVIKNSTRFAMLTNQPAYVDNIIRDVGNQGSIEKVRILSKVESYRGKEAARQQKIQRDNDKAQRRRQSSKDNDNHNHPQEPLS